MPDSDDTHASNTVQLDSLSSSCSWVCDGMINPAIVELNDIFTPRVHLWKSIVRVASNILSSASSFVDTSSKLCTEFEPSPEALYVLEQDQAMRLCLLICRIQCSVALVEHLMVGRQNGNFSELFIDFEHLLLGSPLCRDMST